MTANEEVTVLNASKRKTSGDNDEEPICKRKYTTERFTTQGIFEDEITMSFDDGEHLYVSKQFLRHISHVFYTMFAENSQFVENKTGIVKMVGKRYANVRELLMHLDPNVQKEVNRTNVFQIVPLAEEYMVYGSIKKCHTCLLSMFQKSSGYFNETQITGEMLNIHQKDMVDIFLTASTYGYKAIQERARDVLSKLKYLGSNWPELYNRIPVEEKLKLLENRLSYRGDKWVPARKCTESAISTSSKC